MSTATKFIFRAVFVLILGFGGCRVPYSNAGDEDGGTDDDTGTGIEIPDGGTNGTCPDDSWDNFDNSTSPHLGGEEEIRVEVSISTDFHCPYCLSLAMQFMEIIEREDWKDYVRVYLHHYPLYMHPEAWKVHYAAVATQHQSIEKFWQLHDEVFIRESNKDRMTEEEVLAFVETELGLDMEQFTADYESQDTIDFIKYEREQADAQGLTGTPTVWVCGNKISWGDLEETVDLYLAGGSVDGDSDTDSDTGTDSDTETDTDTGDGGA